MTQKRSEKEDIFPGLWAQTGGGVKTGKTSIETVFEECKEELNLELEKESLYYVASYIRKNDIVDVWCAFKDVDISKIQLQEDEVAEVKFVDLSTFDNMINNNQVVPTINPSYYLLKNYIEQYKE